ncbi:MAG: hypothetical protein KBT30_01650 [Clostridiales bacterium]|nr:hypothetical protein [Candidatus Apopatousia equi]
MGIKLILILILCFLVIFISYKIFCYYKSRQYFFQNLCEFCSYMESQISFLKMDLKSVVESKKGSYSKDFNSLLCSYQKILEVKENFNEDFKLALSKIAILKEDEKTKLFTFFDMLGKSNIVDQMAQIQSFKNDFSQNLSTTEKENNKYGTMSVKLGLLLAVALFVIFI